MNLIFFTIVTDSKFTIKCSLVIFLFCFWLLFHDGHCIPLVREREKEMSHYVRSLTHGSQRT